MRILLIFLLFLLFRSSAEARPQHPVPVVPQALKTDTSRLKIRRFDQALLGRFRNQQTFRYTEDEPAVQHSTGFPNWLQTAYRRLMQNHYTRELLKYAVYAAGLAAAVLMILKLSGLDLKLFSRKQAAIPKPAGSGTEAAGQPDFEQEIAAAAAAGDYRLAIRLYYLFTLQQLNARGLISWRPEKTNRDYASELQDRQQREQFVRLARQFEYTWYGELAPDADGFRQVQQHFEQFNQEQR